MVILFVILTAAIFITLNWWLGRHRHCAAIVNPIRKIDNPAVYTASIERYFHPAHMWVQVEDTNEVTIGIDDFAQRFAGVIEKVDLLPNGSFVQQGSPLLTLHHGLRSLSLLAPVSGTLCEVNTHAVSHPHLLNSSPLEKGWLARIVPTNLSTELRNLITGPLAERWHLAVRAQFIQHFSLSVGPAMQDGGQLVENPTDLLNDDEWKVMVHEFFSTNVSTISFIPHEHHS